ncbi:50S ribosomal protein L11 methyltransferase [Aneurinibacillus aneurinilyticus]|jgi:ribosomal protein L11 methyltransferase|uniref:Methyltransferase n=2 Tax=Aneurinibacillus aneurinilyticus TaxID=1391 RepID=A0A848CRR6_ANEAE|nr:50S ribosomal protein L11 methyltransferase [Aneurinibacillus aneurinilyticus]ERI08077.1 ribosomal protein L11 methyltransferase [Aneurinibacillus aneurinilyticus ATCC 12856]MCI1694383.1 50S ribosomal protein L11 methyltransferase [Aneurinibacillus aneurinilyticus]MED0670510.1 50S ribosomal protein L11 methyltransferase [Aneurinibacillus aneurinilyticus]MED0706510.1 50S ribosomal protein L11 methyltransferase [Aneurinibacillus aneurinilyticus]MED0724425.1 50S ribosomal protein L11 methyltra
MQWIEYQLVFPSETDTESVMYLLGEKGFANSWVDESVEILRIPDGYDYKVKDTDVTIITYESIEDEANMEEEAVSSLATLQRELAPFGMREGSWKEPDLQHADDWKAHFDIEEISNELVLIPIWKQQEAEGKYGQKHRMIFEPGGAFGTGKHGTTQSCLRFIEQIDVAGKNVLDIGAGSGILSIYCEMRGAASVLAVDINPSSPSEIEYLASLNGVKAPEVYVGDGNMLLGESLYDVILINIGGEEAIRQAGTCVHLVKEGGKLIVSGIVEWAEEDVRHAYEERGCMLERRQVDEEWITLMFTAAK